eukprot:33727_1
MSTLPLETLLVSDPFEIIGTFFLSPIGGLLGSIVTTLLLFHTTKQFYIIYQTHAVSKTEIDNRNKQLHVYGLLIAYLTFSILVCVEWAFTRNNFFTASSFTALRCAIGFYGCYILFTINKILLYCLFLHRLRLIFSHGTFRYPPMLYRVLYGYLFIGVPVLAGAFCVNSAYIQTKWILVHSNYSHSMFCTPNEAYDSLVRKIIVTVFAISEFGGNTVLLFVFVKGLSALTTRLSLVKNIEKPMVKLEQKKQTPVIDSDMEFIIQIRQLMKKQTILICITVCSSVLLWVFGLVHVSALRLIGFDVMINSICVWMTFKTSNTYWNCCRKYGCCCVCYS